MTHILNTGIAGALSDQLRIGDLLISTDAVQHDVDVTTFGYAPGQVPGQAESFVADESLATLAQQASEAVDPTRRVLRGRVVSGDQFISSREVKERLVSEFHGDCAEMEGAAIAQGAVRNGLPFVVIRAISDQADGAAEVDYPTFEAAAAAHCARVVEALAAQLSAQ